MKRIMFLVRRLFDMDYKEMFNVASEIKKRTGKSKLSIFLDIIYVGFKYQAGYTDYIEFELYNIPNSKRSTFITRGVNYGYVSSLNDIEARKLLDNKIEFLKEFDELIGREWLDLSVCKFEDFNKFFKEEKNIIAKPVDGMCGVGIQFYTLPDSDEEIRKVYDSCIKDGTTLVEEVIIQHPELSRIHPASINTVRIVTLQINGNVGIPFACLRVGNGKRVDNHASGGLVARIDLETGRVDTPGTGKYGSEYLQHPITGVDFIGFEIPMYTEAIELVKKAANRIPKVGLIGWDIAITNKGPVVVEGNDYPCYALYQSPAFIGEKKIGIRLVFDKMIADLKSKEPVN